MGEDRIRELSDDILVSIISGLPFVEAAATSLISSRFRYLYTYTFGLNFPPMMEYVGNERFPCRTSRMEAQYEKRFPNYIKMIDRVVDSHKGDEAKEFRVHMPCWPGANVERWLQFAFSSKVEIIDIDMTCISSKRGPDIYSLGLVNMIRAAGGALPPALGCLKQVSLSRVGVDDGELHLLLSNSPLLETLSIEYSEALTNIYIVDHSLLLKHLSISYAFNVKCIELGNLIKLESFNCCGLLPKSDLRLYNLPNLIELTTAVQSSNTIDPVWHIISSCIGDQLRLLKFSTCGLRFLDSYRVLPKLINVKRLEMEIGAMSGDIETDGLFPLIKACCSLESLEIKFSWFLSQLFYDGIFEREEIVDRSSKRIGERELSLVRARDKEMLEFWRQGGILEELPSSSKRKREWTTIPKQRVTPQEIMDLTPKNILSANLKTLKVTGYLGCIAELKLILFVLKNFVLGELIVQPLDDTEEIQRSSTNRAWHHLLPVTPKSVNLVIL